jgi:hypothetical protein
LRIVGIQDIGPLGPREGDPTIHYWPFYVRGAWLILPLVLLALLCRRQNRTRDAWCVLLPASLLVLLSNWHLTIVDFDHSLGFLNDSVILFFFAVAFLWLLSYRLVYLPRLKTLAYAVWLLVLAGIIALPAISYMDVNLGLVSSALAFAALAAPTLLAMILAGRACRKRFSSLRYIIWFFIALVPGIGGVLMSLISLAMLVPRVVTGRGISLRSVYYRLEEYVGIGLGGGSILFAFMLPFLALALWFPTYRARFYAIFRLPGMNYDKESGDGDSDDLQTGQ